MSDKPWGGRFKERTSGAVEAYTESISFDRELYAQDIAGSQAHAAMLGRQGVITPEEADALAVRKDVTSSLSRMFRPEFLNRIDRQVIFNRITGENGIKIVDLMLGDLLERLGGRGLGIEVTPEAKGLLAKEGIDEKYGARSLRRVIQQRLEDPISEGILRGDWDDGDVIHVDCEDDGLQIS